MNLPSSEFQNTKTDYSNQKLAQINAIKLHLSLYPKHTHTHKDSGSTIEFNQNLFVCVRKLINNDFTINVRTYVISNLEIPEQDPKRIFSLPFLVASKIFDH